MHVTRSSHCTGCSLYGPCLAIYHPHGDYIAWYCWACWGKEESTLRGTRLTFGQSTPPPRPATQAEYDRDQAGIPWRAR